MSWNILWNKGYIERLPNIIHFITAEAPDILMLQEIPYEHIDQTVDAFGLAGYKLSVLYQSPEMLSTVGVGYNPNTFREHPRGEQLSVDFRALSLDLIPSDKEYVERPVVNVNDLQPDFSTPIDYGNDVLTVISYHGMWGALAQPQRLEQIRLIDQFAKKKGNNVVLGGDFNATIHEPGPQYLLGHQIVDGQSTYWVETQELIAEMGGRQPVNTSLTHGLAANSEHRFDLNRTPERRIDYIFSYGYNYGRQYGLDGWTQLHETKRAYELSDHAPLVAGLLDYN